MKLRKIWNGQQDHVGYNDRLIRAGECDVGWVVWMVARTCQSTRVMQCEGGRDVNGFTATTWSHR